MCVCVCVRAHVCMCVCDCAAFLSQAEDFHKDGFTSLRHRLRRCAFESGGLTEAAADVDASAAAVIGCQSSQRQV